MNREAQEEGRVTVPSMLSHDVAITLPARMAKGLTPVAHERGHCGVPGLSHRATIALAARKEMA